MHIRPVFESRNWKVEKGQDGHWLVLNGKNAVAVFLSWRDAIDYARQKAKG